MPNIRILSSRIYQKDGAWCFEVIVDTGEDVCRDQYYAMTKISYRVWQFLNARTGHTASNPRPWSGAEPVCPTGMRWYDCGLTAAQASALRSQILGLGADTRKYAMFGLSNQPDDDPVIAPDGTPVSGPCLAKAQAIAARIIAGTATPADMAFAAEVQANPGNFAYSNADCSQHSATPIVTTAGFEMPTWGWIALGIVAANEIGIFGKNDFQLIGPLI